MNTIEITHNPFTVNTWFLINGKAPADNSPLSRYRERRLQEWIETLFDELSDLFNGDEHYKIQFTGVESDWLDVREAVQVAKERGAQVDANWVGKAESSEARYAKILALMGDEIFTRYAGENGKIALREATNRDFDVYVVATMSSGKSTLINAMLGRDLLPAANEATTATIAKIANNKSLGERFTAVRINGQRGVLEQLEDAMPEDMKRWNSLPDTSEIHIKGNIRGVQARENVRLVLTDTPGPNNSQDPEHQRTTIGFIQDSQQRNPLILYVLNATQIGVNDDKGVLGLVAESMEKEGKQCKDRFIFVINKMDEFDPEKGEHIPDVLERVRKYLRDNGIPDPRVYPVSANFTRLLRKPNGLQTRAERGFLQSAADLFGNDPEMDMPKYMLFTSRVKRNLDERLRSKLLTELELKSGLPAVESMIDEYIDKYSFPHRIKRMYDAATGAIGAGLNEAEVGKQLEKAQGDLEKIKEKIRQLQERRQKGAGIVEFCDQLSHDGLTLPENVEKHLDKLETRPMTMLRQMAENFRGEVSVATATQQVDSAARDVRLEYLKLINEYEAMFDTCQKWTSDELQRAYQEGVKTLFEECGALKLPVLGSLLKQVSKISVNLSPKDNEIDTRRVATGTKKVSTSTWYKPLTWWSEKEVKIYGDEQYVKLEKLWAPRQTYLATEFRALAQKGREEIASMQTKLADRFMKFMRQEFDPEFDKMLKSLEENLGDREKCEQKVKQAKALESAINNFKERLNKTITL